MYIYVFLEEQITDGVMEKDGLKVELEDAKNDIIRLKKTYEQVYKMGLSMCYVCM